MAIALLFVWKWWCVCIYKRKKQRWFENSVVNISLTSIQRPSDWAIVFLKTVPPFSGGELNSFQNSTRSASNSSLFLAGGMFSSGKVDWKVNHHHLKVWIKKKQFFRGTICNSHSANVLSIKCVRLTRPNKQ